MKLLALFDNSLSQRIRAFTLVEAMVSISILLVGVTGAMTLASNSIATASYTRNKLTASMLAQEAVEAVHAKRDSNFLAMTSNTQPRTNKRFYDGLLSGTLDCTAPLETVERVVVIDPNGADTIAFLARSTDTEVIRELSWAGNSRKFYWQGSTVPSGATASPTVFKRWVTVSETNHCVNGVLQAIDVTATVTWTEKQGETKTLDVRTTSYNWLPTILQTP